VSHIARLPRPIASLLVIIAAVIAVSAVLPSTAASDATITVCVDPTTLNLNINAACTGQLISWNQSGLQGPIGPQGPAGAAGATGATGVAGKSAAVHLNVSKPALVANIEATMVIQSGVLKDVNDDLHQSAAAAKKIPPSSDPTVAALQTQLTAQTTATERLLNVLRAISKAQTQLLHGLE
jgi:hypothetical protein